MGKEEKKMGLRASDTVELIFEDCRVPAENLLGAEGDGFLIAMTSLDGGRIGISSQSLGVAQACLDAAVAYANERVQFGKIISQFQGLRWMIADMATEIEAARLLTFNAAAMRDRGENYSAAASMAKVFASEMAKQGGLPGLANPRGDMVTCRSTPWSGITGMHGSLPFMREPLKSRGPSLPNTSSGK